MASKDNKDTADKDTPAIDFDPLKDFTKSSLLQILEKVT